MRKKRRCCPPSSDPTHHLVSYGSISTNNSAEALTAQFRSDGGETETEKERDEGKEGNWLRLQSLEYKDSFTVLVSVRLSICFYFMSQVPVHSVSIYKLLLVHPQFVSQHEQEDEAQLEPVKPQGT